jgi:ribonuclease P protein component
MSKKTFQPSVIKRKRTHGHQRWTPGTGLPPRQGPCAPERLTPPPANHRFRRTQRVRRREDFLALQRNGKRSQDPCFNVYGIANGLDHARLGITVSRKVSTHAVVRNRIKRQIREYFRTCQNELGGLDLVVIARGAAAGQHSKIIRDSLQHHWTSQKKLCARC